MRILCLMAGFPGGFSASGQPQGITSFRVSLDTHEATTSHGLISRWGPATGETLTISPDLSDSLIHRLMDRKAAMTG